MKFLRSVSRLFRINWERLFAWEAMYDLAVSMLFLPLIAGFFRLIMKVRGYSYLTLENLPRFFLHPAALILVALLVILMTVLSMPNIFAIIFILDQSYRNKDVHLNQILTYTGIQMKRMLGERSILLPLTVLLILPFLDFGMASGVITSITVPEFIIDYIFNSPVYTLLFLAGMAALVYLMLRWIFALHYFVLEVKTYKKARAKSKQLSSKRKFRILILLILVQLLFFVLEALLLFGGILFLALLNGWLAQVKALNVLVSSALWLVFLALLLVLNVLEPLVSYAGISALFYSYKEKDQEAVLPVQVPEGSPHPTARKRARIAGIVLTLLLLAFNSLVINAVYYSDDAPSLPTSITPTRKGIGAC